MDKSGGKRPLARSNSKWEDNIKMNPQEIGWGVGWILLAQDWNRWRTHVNTVMKHWFPQNGGVFLDWLRKCYFSEDPAPWS